MSQCGSLPDAFLELHNSVGYETQLAGADSRSTQHLGFHGFHMFHTGSLWIFHQMICTCSAVPSGWESFSPKSNSPANPPIRTEEASHTFFTTHFHHLSSYFIIVHPSFIIFHQHQNRFLLQPNRVSRLLEMHSLRQVPEMLPPWVPRVPRSRIAMRGNSLMA